MTLEQSGLARPCPVCDRRLFPRDIVRAPAGSPTNAELRYRCDECSRRLRKDVAWAWVPTPDERAVIDDEGERVVAEYIRRHGAPPA